MGLFSATLTTAVIAAVSLGVQLVVPAAALADGAPGSAAASPATAIAEAHAQAVRTGKPVAITSLTTPTETATADPAGTLSITESVYPTRVRSGDGWIPVDTSLHVATNGTLVPAAVPSVIAFSGGGSGPLATMTVHGRTLSVDWSSALPAPSISGSSAVYEDVLPDVDLTVTATPLGGFTEVLTVKSPTAAADPALTSVHLTTRTVGLTVASDAGGNITAADSTGRPYFNSPAADMWDSSTVVDSATSPSPASRTSSTAPAVTAPDDPVGSTPQGPGTGALTAQIPATVSDGVLTLTPDTTVLRGPDTHYPVYIDPGWNPNYAADPRQYYDEVQQGCPAKNALNSSTAPYNTPGVGLNDYSGCIGIERAYYQFKVDTRLWNSTATPVDIVSATLKATEAYSASCAVTSNVNAYLAGGIGTSTDWNNQPGPGTFQDGQSFGPACTSNPSRGFDVSNATVSASKSHWPAMAFVLTASDESNAIDFRRFTNNPTVTVTYDTTPKVTSASTSPPSRCSGGTTIGNTTISLRTSVSDPDRGFPVYANLTLRNSAGTTVKPAVQLGPVTTSGTLTWNIGDLPTGSYTWTTVADDMKDTSKATTCRFSVDATAPKSPVITSTAYPPTDDGTPDQRITGGGTFSFAPASGVTDTANYAYNWGSPPPSVSPPHTVGASSDGKATVTLHPTGLDNWLYVVAIDHAGNQSPPASYEFTLVQPTAEPPAGDITGDGTPDLLADGTNGNLRVYPGSGSSYLRSAIDYTAGMDFHGALTSSGDFDWNFTQDILARQNDGNAYIYPGNGDSEPIATDTTTRVEASLSSDIGFTWSDLTQMVASGGETAGVQGDVDGDGNGPDLFITTSDGNLWLLGAGSATGTFQSATQLNTGWAGKTLVDAQNVGGYPSLWVRDNATGELDLYPGGSNITAGSTDSANNKVVSSSNLTSAAYPQLFGAGDTNGDNLPDLWAEDANAVHNIWFLPSTGAAGTFGARTYVQTLLPHDDFNGDSHADIMDDWSDGTLHEHLGDGTTGTTVGGKIQPGITLAPQLWDSSWNSVRLMTPGDFNGDGYADIAVIYSTGNRASQLWLYPGTVSGSLGSPTQMDVDAGSNWGAMQQIIAGDFNGDATTDLAAVWNDGTLHLYPGNGSGDVSGNQQIGTSTSWNTITLYASSDFNSDGKADLLDIWFDGTMHIHTSSTDTSGKVAMTAGASLGSNWGSATFLIAGDFNADGKPDRLDVYSGQLRYSQGNGNGTFSAPTVIDSSTAWGTMRLVE